MTKTIQKSNISGQIAAIASKSAAHRLYICAALAQTPTDIVCSTTSRDIEATRACLAAMKPGGVLPCGESGSTLRFLLPVAAALGLDVTFHMEGRLPQRPLAPLDQQLTAHGVTLTRPQPHLLQVSGQLTPGDYVLPGNVSSQYISGLLFALPLLDGPSTLTVTGKIESWPYIEMTLEALGKFGVRVADNHCHREGLRRAARPLAAVGCGDLREVGTAGQFPEIATAPSEPRNDRVFQISPQPYRSPGALTVEGDWSNAAFWLCAGALGGPVTVTNLEPDSLQGDKAVVEILERFGAKIQKNNGRYTVSHNKLTAVDIDAAEIPDLVPVLSIVAAASTGTTRVTNAQRLRLKESDRIKTVCAMINDLGGHAEETADGLLLHGGGLTGGTVDSCNDHRIAMAAAVASVLCPVTVMCAEAVEKSYPQFWEDLKIMQNDE